MPNRTTKKPRFVTFKRIFMMESSKHVLSPASNCLLKSYNPIAKKGPINKKDDNKATDQTGFLEAKKTRSKPKIAKNKP